MSASSANSASVCSSLLSFCLCADFGQVSVGLRALCCDLLACCFFLRVLILWGPATLAELMDAMLKEPSETLPFSLLLLFLSLLRRLVIRDFGVLEPVDPLGPWGLGNAGPG